MKLDTIDEAIAEIAAGRCIVVVDDEDRENEGDLVAAASNMTPQTMAFIIRAGGLVCAPLSSDIAGRMELGPMVARNDAPLATAFTVSIDYREGLTTGISARERSDTVRALTYDHVAAADFVRPGHIFPLVAKDGGVLMRSGHTEAAVDLARLAGLPPVGVICEMLHEDGTMMRGEALGAFAERHNLKLISIADLISYRQQQETLVTRLAQFETDTRIGPAWTIIYGTPFDEAQHIALVFGDVGDGQDILTRLQPEQPLEDVFGPQPTVEKALEMIAERGKGIVVYLRDRAAGVMPHSIEPVEGEGTLSAVRREEEWKDVGLGAQILRDIGVRTIRLIASRERQYIGLAGFDVEISGTEIIGA